MRFAVLSLSDPVGVHGGGAMRIRSLTAALKLAGHDVHNVFPSAPSVSGVQGREGVALQVSPGERKVPGFVRDLKRYFLPMPLAAGAENPALTERLREVDPDVFVLTAPSQRNVLPDTRAAVWVDFMDLWSDFAQREASHRRGPGRITASRQARQLIAVEDALADRADAVTTAARRDATMLRERQRSATWIPTPVIAKVTTGRTPPGARRAGFLANFHYWPNQDAYERLVRDWVPRLRAEGWTCVVAGAQSETLSAAPGVEILGRVESLADYYASLDVTLAPIGLGGGMKVKVVESLAYGVPVASSEHGVEGLELADTTGVRIVDLVRPDLTDLASLSREVPSPAQLEPYTDDSYDHAIAEVVESLRTR